MKNEKQARDPNLPRRQYAALPYRLENGLEVMLISSRETHRWILPKGWPMKGRKPHAAAAQEALEEAGVVGKVAKEPWAIPTKLYPQAVRGGSRQVDPRGVAVTFGQRNRQSVGDTRYFDVAGYPGRTLGLAADAGK